MTYNQEPDLFSTPFSVDRIRQLNATFKECFGIPILRTMLPQWNNVCLVPLDGKEEIENSLLIGSKIADKSRLIPGPNVLKGLAADRNFVESCPEGYYMIGFWGYGVNSYAFYYSCVDSWSRVYFRLPYGGVYGDTEKEARQIRNFLVKYFDFEHKIRNKAKSLIAMENMGRGYYKIVIRNEKILEFEESFFENPDFNEKFK